MANLPDLQEQFLGGAAGTAISTSNTVYTAVVGTATVNAFHDSAPTGSTSKAQRIVSGGGNSSNRVDFSTPPSALYFSCYLYIEAYPSATYNGIAIWYSAAGVTKVGDLRLGADGTLQIRDNSSSRWASSALALNVWHRIEVFIDPGESTGHLVNIWSGSNVNGTGTPSQTSGPQSATNAGLASTATISDIRLGSIGNETSQIIRFSRLRGDDAGFPTPIGASTTNVAPTANAGTDQSVVPYQVVTLDASGSSDSDGRIVTYNWSQTSGPSVTLSGSGSTRTFVAPATMAGTSLTFQVSVIDNGGMSSTDSVVVSVNRHNEWVVASDGVTRKPIRRYRVS